MGVGERDNRFVLSSWVGVLPNAEVIYNPAKGLGCQNSRPAITAVVVHSRQYTVNRPDASPAAFHTLHPGGGNFLFMDGSVTVHQGLDQPRRDAGSLHPQLQRNRFERQLLSDPALPSIEPRHFAHSFVRRPRADRIGRFC